MRLVLAGLGLTDKIPIKHLSALMPWVLVLKAVFFCIMLLQRCAVSMNAKSRQMAARHSRLKSKSLGSKSDGLAFRLFRRFRELLNDLENRFELCVVFLLHLC